LRYVTTCYMFKTLLLVLSFFLFIAITTLHHYYNPYTGSQSPNVSFFKMAVVTFKAFILCHHISLISGTLSLNLHVDQQIKIFYQSLLLNQQPVDAPFLLPLPPGILSPISFALFLRLHNRQWTAYWPSIYSLCYIVLSCFKC